MKFNFGFKLIFQMTTVLQLKCAQSAQKTLTFMAWRGAELMLDWSIRRPLKWRPGHVFCPLAPSRYATVTG